MHLLAQSAVLKALGWSLLNSLWQMALLWLVYVAFTHIFKRASSNRRHGLAVLLLAAGTVWTILTFIDALFYTDPATLVYQFSSLPDTYLISSFLRMGRLLISEGLPYFSTLYLLILLFLFARYIKQYFYSGKLTRTGLSRPTPELRVFTEQTARQMGISQKVTIWFSGLVEGPVTLGSLKPVILIPLATICQLNTAQMEALILHELAHIRRQDYLLNLWIAALEVLFFFNPFAKLLIRGIHKQREHRCDDLVLQFRYDPHTYVSALMTLARSVQNNPRLVLAATGGSDRLLLQRVKRILKLHTSPEPLKSRPLVFLFFTLFLTGIALSRPALNIVKRDRIDPENPVQTAVARKESTNQDIHETARITFVTVSMPAKAKPHKRSVHSQRDNIEMVADADQNDGQDAAPAPDDASSDLAGYASTDQTTRRDYSIVAHTATVSPPSPSPYVPNSSFSFQRVQDSTYPGTQYVYMQQMASQQVEQAILKMQKELLSQLKILEQSSSKDMPDLKQKRQIILEQLKLQQQYLEKQHQLQKKLEKVGKKRVIVVI